MLRAALADAIMSKPIVLVEKLPDHVLQQLSNLAQPSNPSAPMPSVLPDLSLADAADALSIARKQIKKSVRFSNEDEQEEEEASGIGTFVNELEKFAGVKFLQQPDQSAVLLFSTCRALLFKAGYIDIDDADTDEVVELLKGKLAISLDGSPTIIDEDDNANEKTQLVFGLDCSTEMVTFEEILPTSAETEIDINLGSDGVNSGNNLFYLSDPFPSLLDIDSRDDFVAVSTFDLEAATFSLANLLVTPSPSPSKNNCHDAFLGCK